MRTFRVAWTGDFLNDRGESAYGELDLSSLADAPHIATHFITEQSPTSGDASYWERFYSLEVTGEQLRNVDALVILRPWVKRAALEAARDLVVIGRSGAGYDKIDVAACTENDVALFNAPLALNHSTGSSALLFMLALAKRLPQQQAIIRAGRWDLQSETMGSEIQGRTLGIIGLGHSGRELVRLAAPFEMNVLAYSPHAEGAHAAALGVQLMSLEELLAAADFVSLHARLTADNHRFFGAEQFARMKRTAYFINVARGELVDQWRSDRRNCIEGRLPGPRSMSTSTSPCRSTTPCCNLKMRSLPPIGPLRPPTFLQPQAGRCWRGCCGLPRGRCPITW